MYDIAHMVQSCLGAGTVVHVAWLVDGAGADPSEAVALTPGGGRTGTLLAGVIDHIIVDALGSLGDSGGLVPVSVGPVEALITGRPEGTEFTVAVVPGWVIPQAVWDELAARRPVTFAVTREGNVLVEARLLDPRREPGIELFDDELVTSLTPIPRVVVAGSGPIADALSAVFGLAEWQTDVIDEVGAAAAVMSTLSHMDAVIVMGHDVETSGRALEAAIASGAGYIGSIGSPRMQQLRREWLGYRGVEWDARVHGPAGFPIGPSNPGEIAVSIVAEAVSSLRAFEHPPQPSN